MSGHTGGDVRAFIIPLVRAALALAAGIVVTFAQDHSAPFGLAVFGAWALAAGLLIGALQLRFEADRLTRLLGVIQAVVTAVAGILALTVGGGLAFLLVIVSAWAAITGFLELYAGYRARGRSAAARDWLMFGGFTAVLALVFLLLPPNVVVSVGILGAYWIILAVFAAIAAFSLKWAPSRQGTGVDAA
ncbi:hypothetical protein MN032_03715 [Agromyces atrinae]|uniref:Uncharacterized membrane protein HdeD (DUF308 family) n=1 Tax=Agromyces atrinae TaxID=592376 RepID=A0A4Q2MD41_9MICO|nr:hypothetical protein [Agromyces atrinae]MCI2956792.1 hypothetical protein [Agromyces atrinae]NYD67853.1 uncharacterized membrane protein HdeD (DUF308 family) [Agromyces atrinae]RXZ87972.1 hypothetical protein ESP50_01905 [Agromyces atrinae]